MCDILKYRNVNTGHINERLYMSIQNVKNRVVI